MVVITQPPPLLAEVLERPLLRHKAKPLPSLLSKLRLARGKAAVVARVVAPQLSQQWTKKKVSCLRRGIARASLCPPRRPCPPNTRHLSSCWPRKQTRPWPPTATNELAAKTVKKKKCPQVGLSPATRLHSSGLPSSLPLLLTIKKYLTIPSFSALIRFLCGRFQNEIKNSTLLGT